MLVGVIQYLWHLTLTSRRGLNANGRIVKFQLP